MLLHRRPEAEDGEERAQAEERCPQQRRVEIRVKRLQNRFNCEEDSAPDRLALVPDFAHAPLRDKLLNISAQDKSGKFLRKEPDFRKISGEKGFRRKIYGAHRSTPSNLS